MKAGVYRRYRQKAGSPEGQTWLYLDAYVDAEVRPERSLDRVDSLRCATIDSLELLDPLRPPPASDLPNE